MSKQKIEIEQKTYSDFWNFKIKQAENESYRQWRENRTCVLKAAFRKAQNRVYRVSVNVATRELERETRNRFFFLCAYYVWACFVEDPSIDFGQVKQVLRCLITPLEQKAREYWAKYDKQGRPEFKSN